MTKAEELLASLDENNPMLYSAEPDTEGHIVIGKDRFITVPEELKRIGVQYDHNIETVIFDCPRYWDGNDMSMMAVYINYRRADGLTGSYIPTDISVDSVDNSIMHFSWTVSGHVTEMRGRIAFMVCVKKTDSNGNIVNHWNSEINKDMYISEGMEVEDTIAEENPDVLTNILLNLNNKADKYDTVITGSFSQNRREGTDIGVYSHAEGSETAATSPYSHAEGRLTTASGNNSHAEGFGTVASGTGSHTEGESSTASGSYSHAEGYESVASGEASHAEGNNTTASGEYSHAEGYGTKASKLRSHAEGGNTTASGNSSHAEGNNTTASGEYSHAEGDNSTASASNSHAEGSSTTASGIGSHAEGRSAEASGSYSHAEGQFAVASGNTSHAEGYITRADSNYQHVQGKYNIPDTKDKYAHIVGNGTSNSAKSNAHTLDWNGNGWFAGKLSQEGDPTMPKDLVPKKYFDKLDDKISILTAIKCIPTWEPNDRADESSINTWAQEGYEKEWTVDGSSNIDAYEVGIGETVVMRCTNEDDLSYRYIVVTITDCTGVDGLIGISHGFFDSKKVLLGSSSGLSGGSGSKILWRGMLLAPYGSIEFNIPEDCFHNNKTTVTLVIESHMVKGSGYIDEYKARGTTPMIVTLSMGNSADFGILDDDEGIYRPCYYEDGNDSYATAEVYRAAAEIDTYAVAPSTHPNMIYLKIKAKKVADSRYAVCNVSSVGFDQALIVTNISAYVPGELG